MPAQGQESSELQSLVELLAIDNNPRASQCARTDELHHAFRVALSTMPDDYRRVIELLYIEQQGIEEVAEQLGKTVDAIRAIRMRARRQLREAIVRLSRFV